MKKGEITLIAFADFSKAFDTVDFAVIIKKLHAIGFSHSSLNWILNYLTGRKQLVQVNDSQSELADVLFGVRRDRYWVPCFSTFTSTTSKMILPAGASNMPMIQQFTVVVLLKISVNVCKK
ncbi:Hypothetical predicted protein [Paramuricea clavata]|uniref:Uncharacterized protein n=1 Tax=Paramuricea clavata TaxID=317549 RepID=A0A6S7GHR0_PARCT|nr:Hypothetical predicted protein [Paramuricea clavata]